MNEFNKVDSEREDAVMCSRCYNSITVAVRKSERVVKLPSRIDPTRDCGFGVVAVAKIRKGALATHYGGLCLSEAAAKALPDEEQTHLRRLVKGLVLDGRTACRNGAHRGLGSFINCPLHRGDAPNVQFRESWQPPTSIEVRALVDIDIGEELMVDYGTDYDDSSLAGRKRVGRRRKNQIGPSMAGFRTLQSLALKRPRKPPSRYGDRAVHF